MKFDGFDWDARNRAKCQKHGVSIAEIESVFLGTPRVLPDIKHSEEEQRFITIGITKKSHYLFLVFTIRTKKDNLLIRLISARYMHQKEIEAYEKEISKFKN